MWPLAGLADHHFVDVDADDVIVEKVAPAPKKAAPAAPKVVILNQNRQKLSQQPSVRVTGAPVSKTHAKELQQSRQEAEVQTEQKIVEKLESDRLRGEQQRFNRLFGGKNAKKTTVVSTGAYQGNGGYPGQSMYAKRRFVKEPPSKDRIYMGVILGQIANLSRQVVNLRSFGSFGVSFGAHDESGLIMDGSFYYSTHRLSQNNGGGFFQNQFGFNNFNNFGNFNLFFSDVRQLTAAISIKYTPFESRFKPYAGVAAMYNLWMYQSNNSMNAWGNAGGWGGFGNWGGGWWGNNSMNCPPNDWLCANGFFQTHSIDVGFTVGVDLVLNKKAGIGFNVLVSVLNLYNNHNTAYNNFYNNFSAWGGGLGALGGGLSGWGGAGGFNNLGGLAAPPITLEETNWLIASVNAKFHF